MKTTYKTREYDTDWWNQRAKPHQKAANQAIAALEVAIARLKLVRDEPVMEEHGMAGVTYAGYAMKSIMLAVAAIWDLVEPRHVPRAEPGILAEVMGAEFYRRMGEIFTRS
jgi:hypothetical protein